jgi:hypothetical protein
VVLISSALARAGCLAAVSIDPVAGHGASADFVAVYEHCEGGAAFRVVQLWIGEEPTPAGARVNLGYEAGVFTLENGGSCAPGDPVILHAPKGSFDCSASTAVIAGDLVTVHWSVAFEVGAFAGSHGLWVDAKGGTGDPEPRLGWTQLGTFLVEADAADESDSGGDDGSASTSGGSGGSESGSSESGSSSSSDEGSIPGGSGGYGRGSETGCGCVAGGHRDAVSLVFVALARRRRRRV